MGIFKRKENYYIDYYFNGQRIRETVGSSKREAEAALQARLTDIRRGKFEFVKPQASPFLKDFAREYLAYARVNKRSFMRDEGLLAHLLRFFHGKRLSDIHPFLIEKYKQQRLGENVVKGFRAVNRKVKPATVNREVALLKRLFNLAIQWGKAKENPVKGVKLFKEEPLAERILLPEEEIRLLAECSETLRPIVILALNTGLRRGELFALKWEDLDWRSESLTVKKSKSGKMRKVPLNAAVQETLRGLKQHGEYVFSGEKPFKCVRNGFEAACRRAGIKGLRFHDLRHTFASRLVACGVDLRTVQELLGHSSLNMVMRYSHPTVDQKKTAVDRLVQNTVMDTKWTQEEFAKF